MHEDFSSTTNPTCVWTSELFFLFLRFILVIEKSSFQNTDALEFRYFHFPHEVPQGEETLVVEGEVASLLHSLVVSLMGQSIVHHWQCLPLQELMPDA